MADGGWQSRGCSAVVVMTGSSSSSHCETESQLPELSAQTSLPSVSPPVYYSPPTSSTPPLFTLTTAVMCAATGV